MRLLCYFTADIRRVLTRVPRWIALAIAIPLVGLVLWLPAHMETFGPWSAYTYMQAGSSSDIYLTPVLGLIEVLWLFGDDFRAKMPQAVIGSGVSRAGMVLVKWLELAVVTALDLFLYAVFFSVLGAATGAPLEPAMYPQLAAVLLMAWISMVCYGSISMITMFATQGVLGGILTYLAMAFLVIEVILSTILEPVGLDHYTPFGGIQILESYLKGGRVHWPSLGLIAGYTAAALAAAILIYRKRELDF